MVGVIAIGCVASVVSIACIVIVAVIVQRKRSRHRRRCELPNGESKTAINDGTGTGTRNDGVDGNVDGGDGGGDGNDGIGGGVTTVGGGRSGVNTIGVCDGDRHHHRADAVDDGLERNPDIIPQDNGKIKGFFFF